MRGRTAFVSVVVAAITAGSVVGLARAEDAPPTPKKPDGPTGPKPPPKPKARTYVGIRWERDFEAGMRRSIAEGRPVYLCMNDRIEESPPESGSTMLASAVYPNRDLGDATHEWVCFVCNRATHDDKEVDDETVCAKYRSGQCEAHQAALSFFVKRFASPDGSLVGPSHAVLDPDGATAYHGEYVQSALSPVDLDRYLMRLSPRLALRRVWTMREARTDELSKLKTEELEGAAKAWIDSKDPWAAASIVAMADQEANAARKKALIAALGNAGPDAVPLLFDAVDAASGDPDTDVALTGLWVTTAFRCDPDFGAWAASRAVVRSKDKAIGETAAGWLLRGVGSAAVALKPWLVEASATRGDARAVDGLEVAAKAYGWSACRLEHAKAKAGKRTPPDLAAVEKAPRDERRRAWMAATADEVKAAREKALAALKDPVNEVQVAAALALRRAGDPSGAKILLDALNDPVEQPDVRAVLTEIAGEDRGESPEAWADVVRAGGGK